MTTLLRCLLFAAATHAFSPPIRGGSRFFLDTANREEWAELLPTGIFHGVTTNPTILQKANEPCTIKNLHRMMEDCLDEYPVEEFMVQAWGDDLYDCALNLLDTPVASHIVIKVPVTQQGVSVARKLIQEGHRVCLTACYSHKQALLAASVGAEYLAPYFGRMNDAGMDGYYECLTMLQAVRGMKSSTRILVASLRDVDSLVNLALGGLETMTFSPEVARELFVNDMTDQAAKDFEQAATDNQ